MPGVTNARLLAGSASKLMMGAVMKWGHRTSRSQVAMGSALATLALIGLGSLSGCGQSSGHEKTVTLNASDDPAAQAALDKQGDMLAQAADRAAGGGTASPAKHPRVYKASDIEWEYAEDAIPYKAKVVAGINKILRENQRCADVETTSLYRAEGFSKKNPVFYVQCETSGGELFGVTFNVDDVDEPGTSYAAVTPIDQATATEACERAARAEAAHPATVSFSWLMNASFRTFPDGRAELASTFTAKNGLGIEGKRRIICHFKGPVLTDHDVLPA